MKFGGSANGDAGGGDGDGIAGPIREFEALLAAFDGDLAVGGDREGAGGFEFHIAGEADLEGAFEFLDAVLELEDPVHGRHQPGIDLVDGWNARPTSGRATVALGRHRVEPGVAHILKE